ncbi:MAG: hypothetical protein V4644_03650 [Patescibacteria group bacterium]
MPLIPVDIRVMLTDEERHEALDYIEGFMRERFGCEPPETRGAILVARTEGRVVGSMAVRCIAGEACSPLERRYAFEAEKAPYPYDRAVIAEGTRLTAVVPGIAAPLFRAACLLAHAFGKRYLLFETKPATARRFRQMGFPCEEIEGARLQLGEARASVGEAGMRYFTETPCPTLYLLDLGSLLKS